MSLTTQQRAHAAQLIAYVRGLYERAYEVAEDEADDFFSSDEERAAFKQVRDTLSMIDRWASVLLAQAERGYSVPGVPYTFAAWVEHGRVTLAQALAYHAQEAVNAGLFEAAAGALSQSVDDAADLAATVANPFAWPPGLLLGVGAVVLLLLLHEGKGLAQAVRA